MRDDVYLVGGYLRDLIGKGVHSRDLDYVVSGSMDRMTRELSTRFNATVVELGKEGITRIVLKDGRTLDFALMNGDIGHDLLGRDFTVNALAWSPRTGLLDPLGGCIDINRGVVRGLSRENFEDDPLRLLRAYRFAAENSWDIASGTRRIIRELSGSISRPAFERITLEFFKLLNSDWHAKYLGQAFEDGILCGIISILNNRLHENLKLVSKIYKKLEKIPETHYFKFFSQGLGYPGLLRLEQLLRGSDMESLRLSLGKAIARRVDLVNEYYDMFCRLDDMTKSEIFDLFSAAGEAAHDLLVLTNQGAFVNHLRRHQRIIRRGLLTGEEIMNLMGIPQGPELGCILNQMKRLQFEGRLRRKREALRWLQKAGHTG